MRTTSEILSSMQPELRKQAEFAITESKNLSSVLASIPSPPALNGQPLDRDDDFLDERYGESDE